MDNLIHEKKSKQHTRARIAKNIQKSTDAAVDTSLARGAEQWREPPEDMVSGMQSARDRIYKLRSTLAGMPTLSDEVNSRARRRRRRTVSDIESKIESSLSEFKQLKSDLRYWAWTKYFYEIPRARRTWHKYFTD